MKDMWNISINKKNIPIAIVLIVVTNKWIFEGVLGITLLEALILGVVLIWIVLKKRFRINMTSGIWLVYCANLIFSVFISGSTVSIWGKCLLMVEIVLIFTSYDYKDYSFRRMFRCLVLLACFHAFFVLVHFFAKSGFNTAYFPMLISAAKESAEKYYRQGYYFGLLYSPHEVAGILCFAVAGILLWCVVNRNSKIRNCILPVALFIVAFLAGKKGVLGISCLVFILTILILFASKKQWLRALRFMVMIGVLVVIGYFYITTHQNNALFYRINQFIYNISVGNSVDSGRNALYLIAITEWNTHKIFGIGWSHFVYNTVSLYGYSDSHQVNMDYLQWLCETGIVGFILNISVVLVMLRRTIFIVRKVVRRTEDNEKKWMIMFSIFIQIFTLLYAFIEVPFYDIFFFTMYMISCSVVNNIYFDYKYMSRYTNALANRKSILLKSRS